MMDIAMLAVFFFLGSFGIHLRTSLHQRCIARLTEDPRIFLFYRDDL